MKRKLDAAAQFAMNIDWLLNQSEMKIGTLAERSGISLRTLKNARSGEDNPTIETVESVARVFKLNAAEILSPTLTSDYSATDEINRIKKTYSLASDAGKDVIRSALTVAEAMAQYNVTKAKSST